MFHLQITIKIQDEWGAINVTAYFDDFPNS